MNLGERSETALIDLDGTVADYDRAMIEGLLNLQSPGDVDVRTINLHDDKLPEYLEKRMQLIKSQPGWWLNLKECKLGMDILYDLIQLGFTPHVCTKGPWKTSSAWTEKLDWCRKHLPPQCQVTVTMDKGLIYGKVLVDDYPKYMDAWLKHRPRGLGVLIDNHHNRDFKHPQVIRYDGGNRAEVYAALKKAKERNNSRKEENDHEPNI